MIITRLFSRVRFSDWLHVLWLGALGLGISAFYLTGQMLDTGYPDWVYHAFRAQSFQEHGLVSWDAIWNNGLSYWRGYQFVPAVLTATLASLANISITQAMLFITAAAFTIFHPLLYVCLRLVRHSPGVAAMVAVLSFAYSGFWVTIGFYSVMFATVLAPPLITLWYASVIRPQLRPVFAIAVGLSVYIHPLLAIGLGGLWVITHLLRRRAFSFRLAIQDLAIMYALSFFYWYHLLFADAAFVVPYQLQKDFLYTVAASLKFGFVYYLIVPVTVFAAVFTTYKLSRPAKYLFWYTALLYLLIILNLHTDVLDILNRYQIYRLGFFIGVALLFVFAELLPHIVNRLPQMARYAAFAIALGFGIAQSLIDSSVYGFTPLARVPDPVGTFLSNTPQLEGSVYINDSTVASYYHPNLRYSNGYNDHLLPQLTNARLRDLLSMMGPDYRVRPETIRHIEAYARVLGVQYFLLPQNSPYITPLTDTAGFRRVGSVTAERFNMVTLATPGAASYATVLTADQAATLAALQTPSKQLTSSEYYDRLDDIVVQMAAIKSAPAARPAAVTFLAPDRLSVAVPDGGTRFIKLDQSYSRHWTSGQATVTRTADNMMLLKVKDGVRQVYLRHTWGSTPIIQIGLATGVGLWLVFYRLIIRRKDR